MLWKEEGEGGDGANEKKASITMARRAVVNLVETANHSSMCPNHEGAFKMRRAVTGGEESRGVPQNKVVNCFTTSKATNVSRIFKKTQCKF